MDFCSFRCLWKFLAESEKLRCEKNSVSEQKFVFTCGFLKPFFVIVVCRFLVIILSFIPFCRFFSCFAEFVFLAIFCVLFCYSDFYGV